ncbi:Uncharacterised protein [Acinetobacter baumannii]|nr:Uncharacterised protein [Acinetobacter baumannii]SSU74309.1 Uncharacterised protein [Acinetobacter baumannii]
MFVQYKDHIINIHAISSINVRTQILQLAISFTNGEKTNIRFDSQEDFDKFLEKFK